VWLLSVVFVALGELLVAGVAAATGELAEDGDASALGTAPPLEELVGGVTFPLLGGSGGVSIGFSEIGPPSDSASVIGYEASDKPGSARQIAVCMRKKLATTTSHNRYLVASLRQHSARSKPRSNRSRCLISLRKLPNVTVSMRPDQGEPVSHTISVS
jgi:hypothetical protein